MCQLLFQSNRAGFLLGILALVVAVVWSLRIVDFRLPAQGIAYLVAVGKSPVQVISPARMTGNDKWLESLAAEFFFQGCEGTFCQIVVHSQYIDETVATIGTEPLKRSSLGYGKNTICKPVQSPLFV